MYLWIGGWLKEKRDATAAAEKCGEKAGLPADLQVTVLAVGIRRQLIDKDGVAEWDVVVAKVLGELDNPDRDYGIKTDRTAMRVLKKYRKFIEGAAPRKHVT